MHRYRRSTCLPLAVGMLLLAGGCAIPSSRENVSATAQLVAAQVPVPLEWRRDPQADSAARQRAEALLIDGLTLDESIAVAFLASPALQLALEQLEISRSEFVAAATPPNPVAVVGTRKPGGDLAAFYPDRSLSVGVLQNVIALLNIPDRRAIARHDLARVRFETAQRATTHAAEVAQAWLEYSAALQVHRLREQGAAAARAAFDTISGAAANGEIGALDVAVERGSLLGAQSATIRSALNVETARGRLGELLGLAGWRDDWRIEPVLPALPAADPDVATQEAAALARRFDLQAASKAVDARLRVLATQRRFRWLNQLEIGVFRDKAIGGTAFTGPNAVVEVPLFDQRQARLLEADAQLRTALRQLESLTLAARTEIRTHAAEVRTTRNLLEQIERDIRPNQQQLMAGLGTVAHPGDPQRLHLRQSTLAADEDHVSLLRDYWRARSALALAAGDWSTLGGLR